MEAHSGAGYFGDADAHKTRPNQKLSTAHCEVTAPIPRAFTAAIDGCLRAERPSPCFPKMIPLCRIRQSKAPSRLTAQTGAKVFEKLSLDTNRPNMEGLRLDLMAGDKAPAQGQRADLSRPSFGRSCADRGKTPDRGRLVCGRREKPDILIPAGADGTLPSDVSAQARTTPGHPGARM